MDNGVVDMSREQYERQARVNWSTLKALGRSPAHYRHLLLKPREDTPALRLGRCCHLAVLEPERFAAECVRWEGGRRAGKEWEAFRRKHAGAEILTEDEHTQCLAIQAAVRNDATAAKYVSRGQAERTILWTHEAPAVGGLPGYSVDCKGRVDFVAEVGALVDLKTCRDASPDAFGRSAWNFGMHAQAAFYAAGYEAATGVRLPSVLVAVEKDAPHVVQVYRVPDAVLEAGREHCRALLDRLAVCRRDNHWPGFADGEELELMLPRWSGVNEDEDADGFGLVFGDAA
jgi:hypothetical protein